MKKIARIALALFVGAIIVTEPETFKTIFEVALSSFGKESAKIEAKKL